MDTFEHRRVTGSIVLDKRVTNKAGKFLVRYRITHLRKQYYYSSGYHLTEAEWKRMPDAKSKDLISTRTLIKNGFDIIEGYVKELGDDFSFELLRKKLSKGLTENIIPVFQRKIELLKCDGKHNTADLNKYALKSIIDYAGDTVTFSEITEEWLRKFERHLIEANKSFTTISIYIRALQAIIGEGMKQGFISATQYPFGKSKYDIPEGVGRNMALNLEQIGKIVKYDCKSLSEERSRDLWFFSYLCNGINMVDLFKLKYSNLENGEISFYRQKTISKVKKKKKIVVPILPQMEQIIKKWGNVMKSKDTYIFPIMTDGLTSFQEQQLVKNATKVINKKMRRIGENLGLGNISTYTARHSFATVLKRSGANIAFISESLGHRDLQTTENYLATFEKDERIRNANLLTNF